MVRKPEPVHIEVSVETKDFIKVLYSCERNSNRNAL